MPLYEHVLLARPDVSAQQVEALVKDVTDAITEGGGKITKTEMWGLKGLAFKIKKNRKAHMALLNIDAPPAAVAEMERRLSIQADVIRFMTVKVEEHETEPSAMMRKQDRDDRGDRGDRGFGGGGGGRGFGGGGRGFGGGGGGGGREGGSTFRPRPPREGGDSRPPRDGDAPRGPRPPRDGDAPRAPRPPRNDNPGSEG